MSLSKKFQKGFTLIELLVVIAIIGILAAIVLASLSSARSKGTDASLLGQMSELKAQAELYYNSEGNGSYGTSNGTNGCTTTGTMFNTTPTTNSVAPLITAITAISGDYVALGIDCDSSTNAWAVSAKGSTQNSTTIYFCADSTGYSSSKNRAGNAYDALTGAGATAAKTASGTACK